MTAAVAASTEVGPKAACEALGVSRASLYRHLERQANPAEAPPRPRSPRRLTDTERQGILDVLHEDRFVDAAPAEVYATLLDEGRHLCSIRTMYRILEANSEVRERRDQLRHPRYAVPRLRATGPNQVWTWDITKLAGPKKWTYYYLYVAVDLYSRYGVAWRAERVESGQLASELIEEACLKQGVELGQLTIHSDRGAPMTSKTLAQLFADLGVTKSHSRPRVSNDNPFSESQFKTLKYRPDYPGRFGALEDARAYCRGFFAWYNQEHHHSGLCLLTPEEVHYGRGEELLEARHQVLQAAYAAHPERFVKGPPKRVFLPEAVWINEPQAMEVSE